MATATMTSKGQITIPVKVREKMGSERGGPGSLSWKPRGGEYPEYTMIAANLPVTALEGYFYDPNRKPVTIEEMNETIAQMGSDGL